LLKDVRSELDQYMYVIDKNLQHTHDFIFCVKYFAFCFMLEKISEFVTRNYKRE